jgi:glucose/mannose-6-phosphate isomerase
VVKIARKHKHSFIKTPGGFPPRAAVGYSLFPTLIALSKLGFIRNQKKEIKETLLLLQKLSARYGEYDVTDNMALNLDNTKPLQINLNHGYTVAGTD